MLITKYLSTFQQVITEQQAQLSMEYDLQTFLDNNLKKIESFSNGILVYTEYFLNSDENLQGFIDTSIINSGCFWGIYTNQEVSNGFSQWETISYSNLGVVQSKGINVFDSLGRSILSLNYDLQINKIVEWPQKYYYGNQTVDNALIQIKYNADGSLYSVYDINDNYNYAWRDYSISEFPNTPMAVDFNFTDHPYYQALTPYLPIGDL